MVTNNKINIKCNLYTRPVAPSRGSNHTNIRTDTALIVDRVDSSDSEAEKKKKKKRRSCRDSNSDLRIQSPRC